jgi:hypothetical protein
MAAQLSDVIIAGTETTALALSTATHFVARDPEVLRKLQEEIRSRFSSYDEISPGSVADLPYVNAVISEAMRVMAPVPWPPSRVVPVQGDSVEGYHLPEGVSSFCCGDKQMATDVPRHGSPPTPTPLRDPRGISASQRSSVPRDGSRKMGLISLTQASRSALGQGHVLVNRECPVLAMVFSSGRTAANRVTVLV